MADAKSRRGELVELPLRHGWEISPGTTTFTARRAGAGKAGVGKVWTVVATLSPAGAILTATVDGQPFTGSNRLARVVAAVMRGGLAYRRARAADGSGLVH